MNSTKRRFIDPTVALGVPGYEALVRAAVRKPMVQSCGLLMLDINTAFFLVDRRQQARM